MTIFWPAFIGGLVLVIAGAVVILKRATVARANADAHRATFGQGGNRVARSSTPQHVLITGVVIVAAGVLGLVLSMSGLDW